MKLYHFPRLVSGVRLESAPSSAVFTDFVWDHVVDRGSCVSTNVLPAFDVRAEQAPKEVKRLGQSYHCVTKEPLVHFPSAG